MLWSYEQIINIFKIFYCQNDFFSPIELIFLKENVLHNWVINF